jgi:hypothetical protein
VPKSGGNSRRSVARQLKVDDMPINNRVRNYHGLRSGDFEGVGHPVSTSRKLGPRITGAFGANYALGGPRCARASSVKAKLSTR